MKHPTSEEWMALLYGEALPQQKAQLRSHLAQCAECASQVRAWHESMHALDAWPVRSNAQASRLGPLVKWVAAAALVIGLGFAAGRFSARGERDLSATRAALRAEFQQQIEATRAALAADWRLREQGLLASVQTVSAADAERLLAEFIRANAEQRTTDLQTIYAAMKQLDTKRQADYATLRRELETVAVLTENSLVHLADYRAPAPSDTELRIP